MKKNILIIGGYGSVGRLIASRLSDRFPGQVIVDRATCNPFAATNAYWFGYACH